MAFRYALHELVADLVAVPVHPYEALYMRLARQLTEAVHDWSPEGRTVARRIERRFVDELFATLARSDARRRTTRLLCAKP